MTFLLPGFLIAAAAAAAAVVALHFLSTREPSVELLPTARFLPDLPVRATATRLQAADPWLLILRVLLVLLIGAALAGPVPTPAREPVARIVAVDISRAVGDRAELADSAERYVARAATVILFDTVAREVRQAAMDSLRAPAAAPPRGSLSPAFVAARRAAARIRDRADSLELVIISPFVTEGYDAATERVRGLWPGRVTTVAVAPAAMGQRSDSIRVQWADSASAATSPATWTAREAPDTVTALRAGDVVLVHRFERRWRLADQTDSERRVLARWSDGEPAAIERPFPDFSDPAPAEGGVHGCERSFGFALPTEGDVPFRPEFRRFQEGLAAPCGEPRDFEPLSASVMASLGGQGELAATRSIERRVEAVTPLAPWLLLAAAFLALLELFVRRGGSGSNIAHRRSPDDAASRVT